MQHSFQRNSASTHFTFQSWIEKVMLNQERMIHSSSDVHFKSSRTSVPAAKQPVSALLSKVLKTFSRFNLLPSIPASINKTHLSENRLNIKSNIRRELASQSLPQHLDPEICALEFSQKPQSSIDSADDYLKSGSAFRRSKIGENSTCNSEPVSRSQTLDDSEPNNFKRLQHLTENGQSHREGDARHEKIEVSYKLRSSPSPARVPTYYGLPNDSNTGKFSSRRTSTSTSRKGSIVSSRRGSTQNSPQRSRAPSITPSLDGTPTASRRGSAENSKSLEDALDLHEKLLEALYDGKFSVPYVSKKFSPSPTPLQSPSSLRGAAQGHHFLPSLHSQLDCLGSNESISNTLPSLSSHPHSSHLPSSDNHSSHSSYSHLIPSNPRLHTLALASTSAHSHHPTTYTNNEYLSERAPPTLNESSLKIRMPSLRRLSINSDALHSENTESDLMGENNKMSCNRTQEERAVRADERNRRRSEVLGRRDEKREDDASKAENVCLHLQEKLGRNAKKVATLESESRRMFWLKIIAITNSAYKLTKNLEKDVLRDHRYHIEVKASRIIFRLLFKWRTKKIAAIKKILQENRNGICRLFSKLVGKGKL